ncbi:DUF2155 domain-containing protein [Roseovarius autotrophicus]|uniref:DUF2155 domain-containing protein n=1 Tax=Roseovarius autotrophicus TaxID=2824121 RepID=UPI001A0D5FE3|nr:DUF2155 domain-containing protein [Roseovarius autotrophicus]MBE0452583.1 DUF2155 domain-containing protein [Roseovarius sp.]
MRRMIAALGALVLAVPVAAQEAAAPGTGAVLRALDKITTEVRDLELANGEAAEFGPLTVELGECRYPMENLASDAYALLNIRATETGTVLFSGWMLASSPALNALEHPRYDIWVLRCTT